LHPPFCMEHLQRYKANRNYFVAPSKTSFVTLFDTVRENSKIEIAFDAEDHKARISVRDYGPGVPEDSFSKIFKPFFRVDDSRNRSTGGVGLGLAIAHRSITLHDGRIWAENANPGLIVNIELPLPVYKT
jgi:signal transduction histidine kinase